MFLPDGGRHTVGNFQVVPSQVREKLLHLFHPPGRRGNIVWTSETTCATLEYLVQLTSWITCGCGRGLEQEAASPAQMPGSWRRAVPSSAHKVST